MENLEDIVSRQNPQWENPLFTSVEMTFLQRKGIIEKISPWLDKRLIIALTGLRRTGKSTLLSQIKGDLLKRVVANRILAFSFEKSQVRSDKESLRTILNYYFDKVLQKIPQELTEKVYIFLDEVQYVPYWQDVVKTYYDFNPHIKIFVSGSTSLFIRKKALESLAGRMIEIVVPPLTFEEYLILSARKIDNLENNFRFGKNLLNALFEEYLVIGQFPEPLKEKYLPENIGPYLALIEEKIVEQDIPKLYSVKMVDVLRLIFNYCQEHGGSIVEYGNLANDLGIDSKLTRRYLNYLEKAYLINLCLNETKKPIRSARTSKKVYLESTNMAKVPMSLKVENYVFNLLKTKGEVKFHRFKDFEVDFVLKTENEVLPVEVKYQEKINSSDYRNLIKLAKIKGAGRAILVSKNLKDKTKVDGITLETIPAVLLEKQFSPLAFIF